jgi:hypothetical protein
MNGNSMPADSESAALYTALERYLQRGGYDGPIADAAAGVLLGNTAAVDHRMPVERRRDELMEVAEADAGWTRSFAELVLDTAADEGVAPGFALELVRSGVGVRGLDPAPASADAGEEMVMADPPPELLMPRPEATTRSAREARLRTTFRRIRRIAERGGVAVSVLAELAAQPDVGRYDI